MSDPFSSLHFAESQAPDEKYGASATCRDEAALAESASAKPFPPADAARCFAIVLRLHRDPPAIVDLAAVAHAWPRALATRLLAALPVETAVVSFCGIANLRDAVVVAQLLRFAGLDDATDEVVFTQLRALHERQPARAFTLRRAMEWAARDTVFWPDGTTWPDDPARRALAVALAAERDWQTLSVPCMRRLPSPREFPDRWPEHSEPLPPLVLPDAPDAGAFDALRAGIEWLHLWRLDATLADGIRAAFAGVFDAWLAALDAATDPHAIHRLPRDLLLLEHLWPDLEGLSQLEVDALLNGVTEVSKDEPFRDCDPGWRKSIRHAVSWWLGKAGCPPLTVPDLIGQIVDPDGDQDAARPLVQLGEHLLVQSAQGFLLVFRGLEWPRIVRQLDTFDAEEWHHTMPKSFHRELAGLDLERLRDAADLLSALVPAALARLDRTLLDMAGGNLDFYNLLHSTTPFRVRARMQALTVLPMLKWEFLGMNDNTDRVRRRIDAGKSVWDAFLDIHPGKAVILRRIATADSGPQAWRGDLARLLAILDPLPPEKVPGTELDWNAFHSIYLGLAIDGEHRSERLAVKQRWLAEAARIGWQNTYTRLTAADGGLDALADVFDLLDEIGHAGDWLDARTGSNPPWEIWREESRCRWLRAPEALGMFRLLDASARWHRALWAEAGLPDDADARRTVWPRLLPQALELATGVFAVTLGNAAELAEEGRRMRHCVGGYWRRCFAGENHIVSLRTPDGESLSTLEIRLPEDGGRNCAIVQHRARHNRTPEERLLALEGRLRAEVIQRADFKSLAEWRRGAAKLDAGFGTRDFDEARYERLAVALGRERLAGLFRQA